MSTLTTGKINVYVRSIGAFRVDLTAQTSDRVADLVTRSQGKRNWH